VEQTAEEQPQSDEGDGEQASARDGTSSVQSARRATARRRARGRPHRRRDPRRSQDIAPICAKLGFREICGLEMFASAH